MLHQYWTNNLYYIFQDDYSWIGKSQGSYLTGSRLGKWNSSIPNVIGAKLLVKWNLPKDKKFFLLETSLRVNIPKINWKFPSPNRKIHSETHLMSLMYILSSFTFCNLKIWFSGIEDIIDLLHVFFFPNLLSWFLIFYCQVICLYTKHFVTCMMYSLAVLSWLCSICCCVSRFDEHALAHL